MAEVAQLFPPADLEEVRLAAAAGDAAVALLTWEPTRPSTQAAMCVATLGLIGSSKAKAELATYARDERPEVCLAIGRAWDRFDRDDYASEVLSASPRLWLDELKSWDGFPRLGRLEELVLFEIAVKDLSPLSELRSLRTLRLKGFRTTQQLLETLAPLESALDVSVRVLWIESLAFVKNFPNAEVLEIQGRAGNPDFSAVGSLLRLRSLTLARMPVNDIGFLASLHDLEVLSIAHTRVRDVTVLSTLPRLRELDLTGLRPGSLTGLESVPGLRTLRIHREGMGEIPACLADRVAVTATDGLIGETPFMD